ncbi:hypothetical protein [Okeania sp. SIO2C2]|uniref:hypothetical protein n=1 Tax=Okeania sp. SIO2C2 TaxID=2607787 RepID=UPI002579BA09|nr:hypothetical protein [Okeania sp. SIO2C2]
MESLLVGVGGRRQPTPRPSQEGRKRNLEEIGAKFCPKIFLPNYAPKILTF